MRIETKKWEDGYFETEYILEKEDKSLIMFLLGLSEIRLGGNPESGWIIERRFNPLKLGENFLLNTVVGGKPKDVNFYISDEFIHSNLKSI